MKRLNGDLLLAVVVLVAFGLSGICCWRHVCMGGHAAHPPYATADVVLDYAWVGLLGVVSIAEVVWRKHNRFLVPAAVILVSTSRLVFGGGGGFLLPLEVALPSGLLAVFVGRRILLHSTIPGRDARLGRGLFLVGSGVGLLLAVLSLLSVIREGIMAIPLVVALTLAGLGVMVCNRSTNPPAHKADEPDGPAAGAS